MFFCFLVLLVCLLVIISFVDSRRRIRLNRIFSVRMIELWICFFCLMFFVVCMLCLVCLFFLFVFCVILVGLVIWFFVARFVALSFGLLISLLGLWICILCVVCSIVWSCWWEIVCLVVLFVWILVWMLWVFLRLCLRNSCWVLVLCLCWCWLWCGVLMVWFFVLMWWCVWVFVCWLCVLWWCVCVIVWCVMVWCGMCLFDFIVFFFVVVWCVCVWKWIMFIVEVLILLYLLLDMYNLFFKDGDVMFLYVMVWVSDLEWMMWFFCVIGFWEMWRKFLENGWFMLVFMVFVLGVLEIEIMYNWDFEEFASFSRSMGYLVYAVDDIFAKAMEFWDVGIEILWLLYDGKMMFVKLLDGILVEIL